MNGKRILLLIVCINVCMLVASFACARGNYSCGEGYDDGIINFFFNIDSETDLSRTGGFDINQNYEDSLGEVLEEEGSGVSFLDGVSLLIDGLKMVIGFLTLLTPIPFLDLFFSFGMPLWLSILIVPIGFILYTISIVEFIRGGEF